MSTPQMSVQPEVLAQQVGTLLSQGVPLGAVYDYTDQDYEVLYALGHSLYSQARYPDALKVFGFLLTHNHLERRFVNAYASSLQMNKRYEDAIQMYSTAAVMDLTDPAPLFHTAECMMASGRTADAREGLELVISLCDEPQHAALKERAEALRAALATYTAAAGAPQGSA